MNTIEALTRARRETNLAAKRITREAEAAVTRIEVYLVQAIADDSSSYLEVCERMRATDPDPDSYWYYEDGPPSRRCPDHIYDLVREWVRRPYLGDDWNNGQYRVGLGRYVHPYLPPVQLDPAALLLAEIESMP